jgi:hypothetical protein
MKKMIGFFPNKYSQLTLIVGLILYQMVRLIVFVNVYGGVEHDSGWFLGVSRSLAERGSYTTLVSTMLNPQVTAGPDLNHEFFQIQDPDGRIYFFAEGTVGPTQIVPDAIMIKLFGSGFWQFRAASLLFYLIFLILASGLLFATGGFWAVFLFHLVFFFYPHLSIFLGYESLGEVPAITCILFSFVFFAKSVTAQKYRNRWFVLSGLVAGLAIISKLISLLALSSLGWLGLILYLRKKITLKEGIAVACGALCCPLAWELIQLIAIVQQFGFEVYVQQVQQRYSVFLVEGSGVGQQATGGSEFFWYKFFLISETSHPNHIFSLISFFLIALGGLWLIWQLKKNQLHQNLVILLWSGWLIHTLWFIIMSENGWVRHLWVALILGTLILSLVWSIGLRYALKQPAWFNLAPVIGISLLIGFNFYSQQPAATWLLADNLVEYWRQKQLTTAHTGLPWTIIPRAEQEMALTALQQLPSTGHIFYTENYKSAEMAALSGRIFYPIQRRKLMSEAKGDVLLFGPDVISPWRGVGDRPVSQTEQQAFVAEIIRQIRQKCPKIIFENNYYIICGLD